ncbi:MAG: phosphoglucosamine mutase [Flavobacteriaceae bacterium]|tara:strand:+ start:348 stop:1727 length:1380 start_codon:yes stop_codon:yes gene_type:complete
MPLIKSISGIRGTLKGDKDSSLNPDVIKTFTSSFVQHLKNINNNKPISIAIGRDGRVSGKRICEIVCEVSCNMGINIIDLGYSTTPSVEVFIDQEGLDGGIMISASHNGIEWNALKLFNSKGEFISKDDFDNINSIIDNKSFNYENVKSAGKIITNSHSIEQHIELILSNELVNINKIKSSKLKIVVDGINSTGGIAVPYLLERLDVEVVKLNCEPDGNFIHDPEPLEKNLIGLSNSVVKNSANLGIAVDPDVDRLAFIDEKGTYFGEEYTLVACADYVLNKNSGPTVSNLSSTKALRELTEFRGCNYFYSAVGEVNVVEMMKNKNAVIGGEGNGGVILPSIHYGRDALIGIALFLSHLVEKSSSVSNLRKQYPSYYMAKKKMNITNVSFDEVFKKLILEFLDCEIIEIDGLKIIFKDSSWVHLRKSNTEDIIRIYSESDNILKANQIADKVINLIENL